MEIIRLNYNHSFISNERIVATIGEFDGVHIAHQKLFKDTLKLANEKNSKSAVITFDPHPDVVLGKNQHTIMSMAEKNKVIESFGFDYLFIIHFDDNILQMPHDVFVNKFLLKLNVTDLVVGFDFRYGYKGLGSCDTIKEDSLEKINVLVIEEQTLEGNKIGSSLIKTYLSKGLLKEVNYLLGRNFKLSGYIIHGNNIGEKINVPTANLDVEFSSPVLKQGVYAGYCFVKDNKHNAIINIGHNPSFNYRDNLSYEIHIIDEDFNETIYDNFVELELVEYLREEVVFEKITDFQKQIEKDKKTAFLILNNAL